MKTDENVSDLVKEYRDFLPKRDIQSSVELLVTEHEWSQPAAEHLLWLAEKCGSFMLRNALALSLALGIDDGELMF